MLLHGGMHARKINCEKRRPFLVWIVVSFRGRVLFPVRFDGFWLCTSSSQFSSFRVHNSRLIGSGNTLQTDKRFRQQSQRYNASPCLFAPKEAQMQWLRASASALCAVQQECCQERHPQRASNISNCCSLRLIQRQ